MGVTGLWPILAPVKKHTALSSLQGQTVAVDLSIWVCENQAVRQMQSRVLKPHLRNLFFRISTLLQLGVKLVFVIEGEAPTLKHAEMGRRQQARNKGMTSNSKRTFGRGRFNILLKECCELLDAVGVPYIKSCGEAERLCAALNAAGIVDACMSDDGDCFLYGARMVYRNLTLDTKDPHVESYSMADVTSDLGLTRERLVALALLLGCDYYPAGVPGVGETWAVKLMTSLATEDILNRFKQWRSMTASDCIDSIEVFVWRKASSLPDFPPQEVIDEFLVPKERVPSVPPRWQRPCILKMMALGSRYLNWPQDYSLEKVLPLTTLWDQLDIIHNSLLTASDHFRPCRILKRRVRQGVRCFEVEWKNQIKGLVDDTGQPRKLVTLEQADRFQTCFAAVVESFIRCTEELKAAKPKGSRKPKARRDMSALTDQMDDLSMDSQCGVRDNQEDGASCRQPSSTNHHMPERRLGQLLQPTVYQATETCSVQPPSSNSREESEFDTQEGFDSCGAGVFGEEPPPHDAGSKDEVIRKSSLIDRNVEHAPVSQRPDIMVATNDTCKDSTSVIDLDESYTYIPLSQRLKARFGSRDKKTSASSSTSSSSQLERIDSLSETDIMCVEKTLHDSTVSVPEAGKHQTSGSDCDAHIATCCTLAQFDISHTVESLHTKYVPSISAQKSGGGNRSHNTTQATARSSTTASKTSSMELQPSSHLPEAAATAHSTTSRQCMSESGVQLLHSLNKKVVHENAVAKKLTAKKRMTNCGKRKERTCSQTAKMATILSDLLDNWSDTDSDEGRVTENQNSSSITVDGYDSGSLLMNLSSETQVSSMPAPQKLNSIFSSLSSWPPTGECAQTDERVHTYEQNENSLLDAGADAYHRGSVRQQTLDVSHSDVLFVSDSHFTLHHSLFTSMEDSNVSCDVFVPAESSSSHCLSPVSTMSCTTNTDEREPRFPTTHSGAASAVTKTFLTQDLAGEPVQLDNKSSEVAEESSAAGEGSSQTVGPSASPVGECMLLVGGSSLSACVASLGADKSSQTESQSASCVRDGPLASCVSGSQLDLLVRDSTAVDEPCQTENSRDKVFLPLSQRLQLKRSNSKGLNGLTDL